jgi:hypothetical protein
MGSFIALLLELLHLLHLEELLELEHVHGAAAGEHATKGVHGGGLAWAGKRGVGLALHVLADLLRNGSDGLHELDDVELKIFEEGAELRVGHDHCIGDRLL